MTIYLETVLEPNELYARIAALENAGHEMTGWEIEADTLAGMMEALNQKWRKAGLAVAFHAHSQPKLLLSYPVIVIDSVAAMLRELTTA